MKTRIDIKVFNNGETESTRINGVSISMKAKKKGLFYNDIKELSGADICCILDALNEIEKHMIEHLDTKGLSYNQWKKHTKVVNKNDVF